MKDFLAVIGMVAFVIILLIFSPFIMFWLCYFGGWITMHVVGDTLANALNVLFNVQYFSADKIPMIAGALGWIGSYFKASTHLTSKEREKR